MKYNRITSPHGQTINLTLSEWEELDEYKDKDLRTIYPWILIKRRYLYRDCGSTVQEWKHQVINRLLSYDIQ